MVIKTLVAFILVVAPKQSAQWEELAATTASLRTGGAHIVSSDALELEQGKTALITYWEAARGSEDQDVYRCVDIVDQRFAPISQSCWKVLTPAIRRPIESD